MARSSSRFRLAHGAESLFSRVREREIQCRGGYADLALRATDMLRDFVNDVSLALEGTPMDTLDGYDGLVEILANPEAAGITAESTVSSRAVPRLGKLLVAPPHPHRVPFLFSVRWPPTPHSCTVGPFQFTRGHGLCSQGREGT